MVGGIRTDPGFEEARERVGRPEVQLGPAAHLDELTLVNLQQFRVLPVAEVEDAGIGVLGMTVDERNDVDVGVPGGRGHLEKVLDGEGFEVGVADEVDEEGPGGTLSAVAAGGGHLVDE